MKFQNTRTPKSLQKRRKSHICDLKIASNSSEERQYREHLPYITLKKNKSILESYD